MSIRFLLVCAVIFTSLFLSAQNSSISGIINDEKGIGIPFATIILNSQKDSSMVKADITSENGKFLLEMIPPGRYFTESSYIGLTTHVSTVFELGKSPFIHPPVSLMADAKQLDEVLVTAQRALIEVKPDRTVFNVQGTINSAGENGLNILRKAPGVLVDNNNNITVLGRAGVLLYVDGKRIPLRGDDLTNYLQNLSSEQIDKIDIITNPGSKYEAQGNAGIIDIRLKKDKNLGGNSSISGSYGHGRYGQGNINANGNYRNKKMNTFGGLGYNKGVRWNKMLFDTYQNGFRLNESNISTSDYDGWNGRWGTDFFISTKSTIGFIVGAQTNSSLSKSNNLTYISNQAKPAQIDSILTAPNTSDSERNQATFNINYAYESGKNKLTLDADYGSFRNQNDHIQPNLYYDPSRTNIISQNLNTYNTPVTINIATAKADFTTEAWGGNLDIGTKFSNVVTDNKFLFYNVLNGVSERNDNRSNQFKYDENVIAGYLNYSRKLNAKWNASAGLRVENTNATGDLIAFLPQLEEAPVDFNYNSFFPSAGLTYQHHPEHVYSLNYGRRINRPDYNVLNPFREQLSELSYSRGNKFLQPEIVDQPPKYWTDY